MTHAILAVALFLATTTPGLTPDQRHAAEVAAYLWGIS
jgi:hypothetical protein